MYASIRHYNLNPIFERDFVVRWTAFIEKMKRAGIIVEARLHRENRISFISYVTFSNKENYVKLSELIKGEGAREWSKITDCCNSINELHRMELIAENHLN